MFARTFVVLALSLLASQNLFASPCAGSGTIMSVGSGEMDTDEGRVPAAVIRMQVSALACSGVNRYNQTIRLYLPIRQARNLQSLIIDRCVTKALDSVGRNLNFYGDGEYSIFGSSSIKPVPMQSLDQRFGCTF
jgi:hypothetical protein